MNEVDYMEFKDGSGGGGGGNGGGAPNPGRTCNTMVLEAAMWLFAFINVALGVA